MCFVMSDERSNRIPDTELCRAAYLSYINSRAGLTNAPSEGARDDRNVAIRPNRSASLDTSASPESVSTRSPNDVWDEHIRQLVLFQRANGHCRVPRHHADNPKLGRWVMNVRSHYQLLKKGRRSSLLTQERLRQLEGLDFDFAPKNKSHTQYYTDRWEQHVAELEEFKSQHGHCRVPQRYKENKKLGGWVLYVRNQYRKHKAGQPNTMTHERIQQLEDMGFDFNPRKGRPGSSEG